MEWIAPKLDWNGKDPFALDPDYTRIRQNLLYLQQKASEVVGRPDYAQMKEYSIKDVPLAEFFNRVEENLARVEQLVQNGGYRAKHFKPGDFVWDWQDLNQIEALEQSIYNDLRMIENGQQMLAFYLGGGIFGAFVS